MANSGVFPCYENDFKVKVNGTYTSIADCETFEVTFDNGIEEWHPFEEEGWVRRLMTAKSVTVSVSGKRNVGDTGNDYIASLAFKNGLDAIVDFKWTMWDGTIVEFKDCPINVTALGSGASTDVAPLEFEILSNKKPTVTSPSS